jgi:FlaA1/EpsC-like NDP-sugar epimerase
VRATMAAGSRVETVIGISTDKACKPINVMGMTKAVMERIFVEANLRQPDTRFACVRYGNVVASRGSVVPLFLEQIAKGGPVTVTLKEMTRFLLTLDRAVDTVIAALQHAQRGEIYVPRVPAARMTDLAEVLIDGRDIPIVYTGIRPGEKSTRSWSRKRSATGPSRVVTTTRSARCCPSAARSWGASRC